MSFFQRRHYSKKAVFLIMVIVLITASVVQTWAAELPFVPNEEETTSGVNVEIEPDNPDYGDDSSPEIRYYV